MKPTEEQLAARTAWFTALRSGEYAQGTGGLYNSRGYCCLGVDCKIAGDLCAPETDCIGTASRSISSGSFGYPGTAWFAERHGIHYEQARTMQRQAAGWNDEEGRDFAFIADALGTMFTEFDRLNELAAVAQ